MPAKTYSTSDILLAAYLRLQGYNMVGIERKNGRGFFIFEDKPNRESKVMDFFNKKTRVESIALLDEVKTLKAMVNDGSCR